MNSRDYFSYIRDFPHSLSIFLTYTLEKEVIDKIRENSSGRTIIIHDLTKGINLSENYDSRFICIPAIIPVSYANCFHSKIAILKGTEKIRVLVGSMNLTRSSFSSRNEICIQNDITPDSEQMEEIIRILSSIKIPKAFNIDFLSELQFTERTISNHLSNGFNFIHNATNSIFEEFIRFIPSIQNKKPTLKIATPFLSQRLSDSYNDFVKTINPNRIELYTRGSNKLPNEIKYSLRPIFLYRPIKHKQRYNFHAKIILIDYGNKAILYIGSANFTEQGFFKSLIDGGNQESGIVLKIEDKIETQSVKDWFDKGWEKPQSVEDWKAMDEPTFDDPDNVDNLYAFAIKENRMVKLHLFLPDESIEQIRITVNSKKQYAVMNNEGFYLCELDNISASTEILKVKYGKYPEIAVAIFSYEKYQEWIQYDGDGLFSYQSSPIESVNDKELSRGIEREGIKVGGIKSIIIEPPKLEQFYYNVKREVNFIKHKRYFSNYHLQELEKKISSQIGGMGIYLIMQLLKTFMIAEKEKAIDLKQFKIVCTKRLNQIVNDLGENKNKFNFFLQRWLEYDKN
jgi:hypothetical protein